MTPTDPLHDPAQLDSELVAYLDGELDETASRRIEQLLATRPEVCRRLGELQQAWEMLDQLDRSETDQRLTQSTMEAVVAAAESDASPTVGRWPTRRVGGWLSAAAVVMATTVLGFGFGAVMAPDPNRELIENLPVLENLDAYRQVDSVDFLRMLRHEGLFSEEQNRDS